MISHEDKEELKACMPILLDKCLGVTNHRKPFTCPNPDHEDRHPSAGYYKPSNTVRCFACDMSWDVFGLAGMLYNVTGFVDQAKCVASIVGYQLSEDSASRLNPVPKPVGKRPMFEPPKEAVMSISQEICEKMYRALFTPEGNIGRRYLHSRGIGDDDIVRYGLGFSMNPSEQIPEFSIYEPGALGFVMIPYYDQQCDGAVYCMARSVGNEDVNVKEWRPKGVASPLWREWLLGIDVPEVCVVEGLLDAISLEKMIEKPCVALGGTSYTGRLASVLNNTAPEKRPEKILIAMDFDRPGENATTKIEKDLDIIGIPHAKLPGLDGAKDANEYLMARYGTDWVYITEAARDGLEPYHWVKWADHVN